MFQNFDIDVTHYYDVMRDRADVHSLRINVSIYQR